MITERGKFRDCETRSEYSSDSPYRCDCNDHVRVAKQRKENGELWVGLQCMRCGKKARRSAKIYTADEISRMREVDNDLHQNFMAEAGAKQQEQFQRDREEASKKWWAEYHAYLETDQWRDRRVRVLGRANHTCEACLEAKATEVHHTTYEHLGNEPLFELRAVCHGCHEAITKMDRERRGG